MQKLCVVSWDLIFQVRQQFPFSALKIIITFCFKGEAVYLSSYYYNYNRETVPVHMSDVQCLGTESRLTECSHNTGSAGTIQDLATQVCNYYFNSGCI